MIPPPAWAARAGADPLSGTTRGAFRRRIAWSATTAPARPPPQVLAGEERPGRSTAQRIGYLPQDPRTGNWVRPG
jgi:hypothetical protein